MRIFKKAITRKEIAEIVTQTIVDDGRLGARRFFELLKKENFEAGSLPSGEITEKAENGLIVFVFFRELRCLENLFPGELSQDLSSLSVDYLCRKIKKDRGELLSEIHGYERQFSDDLLRGVNPYDSRGVLSVLAERMGLLKTVDVCNKKSYSPLLLPLILAYAPIGRWKKVKGSYKIK